MKCAICGEEINPLLGYVYDNPDENGDPTPQSNFYHPGCIEKAIKEKQES